MAKLLSEKIGNLVAMLFLVLYRFLCVIQHEERLMCLFLRCWFDVLISMSLCLLRMH